MRSTVIIVAWNGADYIGACISSVIAQSPAPNEIIIVDNASQDETPQIVDGYSTRSAESHIQLRCVRNNSNLGFTRAANIGLRIALASTDAHHDDMLVLLNQDATVEPGWLAALRRTMEEEPQAGAVGCKIFYPGRHILQHAGGSIERSRLIGFHYGQDQRDNGAFDARADVDYVTGAAVALRAGALRQVGLLDEVFSPGYYEDVEICWRLRHHGWRIIYCPSARVIHVESASFERSSKRSILSHRNRLLFALRVFDKPAFLNQFVPAEQAHIQQTADLAELHVLATAYAHCVITLIEHRLSTDPMLVEAICNLRSLSLKRLSATFAEDHA